MDILPHWEGEISYRKGDALYDAGYLTDCLACWQLVREADG